MSLNTVIAVLNNEKPFGRAVSQTVSRTCIYLHALTYCNLKVRSPQTHAGY